MVYSCPASALKGTENAFYRPDQAETPRSFSQVSSFLRTDKIIRLGGIFSLTDHVTSDASFYGIQRLEAFRCLIGEINRGGYGNDMNITLVYTAMDSQTTPSLAVAESISLAIEKNVTMVIGPNDSQETYSAAAALSAYGIGSVSYSASAPFLDYFHFRNLLLTLPQDSDANEAVLSFIESLGWKLVIAVFTADLYGLSGRDFFFRAHFQGRINLTCVTTVPVLDSDVSIAKALPTLIETSRCASSSMANVVLIYCMHALSSCLSLDAFLASVASVPAILSAFTNNTLNDRLTYIGTAWITFVNDPVLYSYNYFPLSAMKGEARQHGTLVRIP